MSYRIISTQAMFPSQCLGTEDKNLIHSDDSPGEPNAFQF
jgi:hypothetical protein